MINPPSPDSLVLGINSVYHESSAALVQNGQVLCAVEEERLTRRKHGKSATVSNPDELPWEAIRFCLKNIDPRQLDAVAYSFQPKERVGMIGIDPYPVSQEKGFGTEWGEVLLKQRIQEVPSLLSQKLGIPHLKERVHFIPHHLSHAASAFYSAPFSQAAVLVVDGIGERATGWVGQGSPSGLKVLHEIPYPSSIGFLWERIAQYLGFTEYDAAKVMGLAAFGNPRRFSSEMDQLFGIHPPELRNGYAPFWIDSTLAGFRRDDLNGLISLFGAARRKDEPPETSRFADLAAALQVRTEEVILRLAWDLYDRTRVPNLVYAGGVALNCVANARLEKEGPFEQLYIYGAAHDAGTAVGAALEVTHNRTNRGSNSQEPRRTMAISPFLGPDFDETVIDQALDQAGLGFKILDDPADLGAQLLAQGLIVGWFQGRLEFGPRALGNRSLLADPRDLNSRTQLNNRVKHREAYRPFAASVLEEEVRHWFDVPNGRKGAEFSRNLMVLTYPVLAAKAGQIPAVLHQDRSCRLQVVNKKEQPLFHRLISCFFDRTGVPLVLNTSFNDQEPLVATPEHAIATFKQTHIDALFLHDRLILKVSDQESPCPELYLKVVPEGS